MDYDAALRKSLVKNKKKKKKKGFAVNVILALKMTDLGLYSSRLSGYEADLGTLAGVLLASPFIIT